MATHIQWFHTTTGLLKTHSRNDGCKKASIEKCLYRPISPSRNVKASRNKSSSEGRTCQFVHVAADEIDAGPVTAPPHTQTQLHKRAQYEFRNTKHIHEHTNTASM